MGKDTVVFACNIPGHFEAGMKQVLAIEVLTVLLLTKLASIPGPFESFEDELDEKIGTVNLDEGD